MPRGREFELKFAIDPRDAERLFRHPAIVATAPRRTTSRLVSTYFDTPDAWLRRHRLSLRVRRSEAGFTHTLKRARYSVVDRDEWEHEGGPDVDVDWLKTTPLWPLLRKGDVAGKLEPHFSVEVDRVTLPLAYRGASIEGALDAGAIRARGLTSPVSEFELELREGRAAAVFALGRRLARDLPLVPSLATKSEHGRAVADLTWGRPASGLDLDLSGVKATGPAFAAIMQACLGALFRNAGLIVGDDDSEAVHKARVALRRLRTAIDLFAPVLRRKRIRRLRQDLKWATARFGEARDSDVFRDNLDAAAVTGETELGAIAARARRRAHTRLRKALGSPRWRLLCLDLVDVSMTGLRRRDRSARYRPFVRRRLARHLRRLARDSRKLRGKSEEERHEIRKRAKSLRYAIEFVADVAGLGRSKAARRLRDDLETMQQTLGTLHDRHALRDHLRELVGAAEPPLDTTPERWARAAFAAGRLSGMPAPDDEALDRARRASRRIRRSTAFA